MTPQGSSLPSRPHVLIATLGDQPQVITRALDELLRRGFPVRRVMVIHTSRTRKASDLSVGRVVAEETYPAYTKKKIEFRYRVFQSDGARQLEDIKTEADAQEVLRVLFSAVRAAKQEGAVVHLSIAGGRKVVSAYGMVAAQMLFDEGDFCWHLYEGPTVPPRPETVTPPCPACNRPFPNRNDAMHAEPGEETILIPVPVLPLPDIAPVLTQLGSDPWELLEIIKRDQERARDAFLREFLKPERASQNRLTPTECQVLRLLCEGKNNDTIARELPTRDGQIRSLKSVRNMVDSIESKFDLYYKAHFEDWPKNEPLDQRAIISIFVRLLAKDGK